MADALFDGRKLRALTVVDNFTRESLAIEVAQHQKLGVQAIKNVRGMGWMVSKQI